MAPTVVLFAIAALLFGAVNVVLLMLVVGGRAGGSRRRLTAPRARVGPGGPVPGQVRSGPLMRTAAFGLRVLAAAARAVRLPAQDQLVGSPRHPPGVAGLEAASPDPAALVFACLGIALALHGR